MMKTAFGWSVVLLVSFCSMNLHAAAPLAGRTDTYSISEISSGVGPSGDVDVVLVVDDSGSMLDYQEKLIQALPALMNRFRSLHLNAKFAVVSTTETAPYMYGMSVGSEIYSLDPLAEQKLADGIRKLGNVGDAVEKPFMTMLNALVRYPTFKRANVPLWTVLFTDEDEQSQISAVDFIDRVERLTSLARHYVSAIVHAVDLGCSHSSSRFQGSVFEQLMQISPGSAVSPICQTSPLMEKSITDVMDMIPRLTPPEISVALDRAVPSSVRVFYRGVELKSGADGYWSYEESRGRVIWNNLDFVIDPARDQISITYEIR